LAALLSVHGVAPDCAVALQLHRSLEQVAGVVGALRSGGAYLPLDSKWPLERRKFMVDDAPCAQLVAQAPHAAEFQGLFSGTVLVLDDARRVPTDGPVTTRGMRATPKHLAYVMYTSGSTGKPKGVMLPHVSVSNLLHGTEGRYPADGTWIFGLSTVYIFDVFVHVLFTVIGVLGGECLLLVDGKALLELGSDELIRF
jgi:non-ribosomal peptide synthetase component F